jgi:hypothetical protein
VRLDLDSENVSHTARYLKAAVERVRDLQKLGRESGAKRRRKSAMDLWRRDKSLSRRDLAKIGYEQLTF